LREHNIKALLRFAYDHEQPGMGMDQLLYAHLPFQVVRKDLVVLVIHARAKAFIPVNV
jgi:hypothetical protein